MVRLRLGALERYGAGLLPHPSHGGSLRNGYEQQSRNISLLRTGRRTTSAFPWRQQHHPCTGILQQQHSITTVGDVLHTLPGYLVPPTVFVGLVATLWIYKAFVTVVFQEKIIYMPYMPPFTRSEKAEDYEAMCRPVVWREEGLRAGDGVRVKVLVGRIHAERSGEGQVEGESAVEGVGMVEMGEMGKRKRVVICYFHGNGGSLPPRLPLLSNIIKTIYAQQRTLATDAHVEYTLAALSYRGYWTSSGKPSQAGFELDAQALMKWVNDTYTTTLLSPRRTNTKSETRTDTQLILWGQSIGAGVASTAAATYAHLTSTRPAHVPLIGLILETPFTSIKSMLLTLYPQKWLPYRYLWPFLRSHWDSEAALRSLASSSSSFPKVLIVPASRDEIVPAGEADKLEGVCKEAGLEVERKNVLGALHVEATTRKEGREAVAGFVVGIANGKKG